ncbi:hypothetical protein [Bdellovibrio svalbardensis]|uniref:Uncharacterized protein n=1 Tax=Bdellovibrio svalbardensis TaxID=2972972 RepID=A0ABT6DF90_9BACT|nr:hypothetical protein [Bdellovibrio svalbardensis]MDG0815458.1 hypothetical protein [Bdellovibrio svalbardensis]
METILKNEKGFALALMMALLPILIGLILVTFAIVSFVQIDLKLHQICRSESLKGQEAVAPLLKSLLALNPLALKLKLELIQAKAQAVSGNPAALARLAQVEAKVLKLITQQQQLIKQSNLLLLKAHTSNQIKLWNEKDQTLRTIPLFKSELQVLSSKVPTLAVRPDSIDRPPTYSPAENFSNRQALEQRWQYRLSITKPLQPFLTGNYVFEKSCAVTLKEENSKWFPQMKRDRSLSKSH